MTNLSVQIRAGFTIEYRNAAKRKAAWERAHGATQAMAAKAVGVRRQTVTDWERLKDAEYHYWLRTAWQETMRGGGYEAMRTLRRALRETDEKGYPTKNAIMAAARIMRTVERTKGILAKYDPSTGTGKSSLSDILNFSPKEGATGGSQ